MTSQTGAAAKQMALYVALTIVSLFVGMVADFWGASVNPVFEAVKALDAQGNATSYTQIKTPVSAQILRLVASFAYTIAGSVFVSIFVTSRIEKAQKEESETQFQKLHAAINANVFDALFKTLIPEEIYSAIKTEIISNKIVRRNAEWVYEFVDESSGIVLRRTLMYELHNVGQEDVANPVKAVTDSGDTLEQVTCVIDGEEVLSYRKSDNANAQVVSVVTKGNATTMEPKVTIPRGKHARMTLVFRELFPGEVVNDSYFTKYPVIGARLQVNFPKKFEFTVFPSLSTELKCIVKEPGRSIYEARGGILPHQGFTFTLKKGSSSPPAGV